MRRLETDSNGDSVDMVTNMQIFAKTPGFAFANKVLLFSLHLYQRPAAAGKSINLRGRASRPPFQIYYFFQASWQVGGR